MATKVYSLRDADTLANIISALDTTEHHAFPLVGEELTRAARERRASKEHLGGTMREENGHHGFTNGNSTGPTHSPKGAVNGSTDHASGDGSPKSRSPEALRPPDSSSRRQFAGIISREQLEHVLSISGVQSAQARLEAKAASYLGTRLVE